jgi:lipoprotein signal peptidase
VKCAKSKKSKWQRCILVSLFILLDQHCKFTISHGVDTQKLIPIDRHHSQP